MQRPWNLASLPVYSLATYRAERLNMNICTYVTPISMQPKLYAIAVYQHTLTLQIMQQTEVAVLQLLHAGQYGLVRHLGQKSGHVFSKQLWLQQKQLLTSWKQFTVLKDAAAYVQLQKIQTISTEGDHVLFLYKALHFQSLSADILTTALLSAKKIIRI
ncbi:MAG TPA: flavin reductase [Sediminibacterium sp.]|nr:flavin reductase [Sediminibacterium sp.]